MLRTDSLDQGRFSENIVKTTLLGTDYSFHDTGLTPNVHYYFQVQPKNDACGKLDACGGKSVNKLRAVGVPLPPTLLNLIHLVDQPNVIRADWALPIDTGLGDGSLNREQSLYRYTLHVNGVKVLLVTELNTSYIATGLTSGTSYNFVVPVTATNIAGDCTSIAAGLPLAVVSFTANVNPTDGALKIQLDWVTPSNTGQGNQVE